MVKIKICGIMEEQTCDVLNEVLSDYAGFIFAEKSRRYITPETACRLREKLDRRIQTVGVFVDEDIDTVCSIARTGAIDAIQLHGNEDAKTIFCLKEKTGLPIIKAYTMHSASDVGNAMRCAADMLLLDNGCGTGEMFDHDLLEDVDRLYILAGGLDPENVADAVTKYCPYGVDVSSGVETDGKKDADKIRRFIKAVRSAQMF